MVLEKSQNQCTHYGGSNVYTYTICAYRQVYLSLESICNIGGLRPHVYIIHLILPCQCILSWEVIHIEIHALLILRVDFGLSRRALRLFVRFAHYYSITDLRRCQNTHSSLHLRGHLYGLLLVGRPFSFFSYLLIPTVLCPLPGSQTQSY